MNREIIKSEDIVDKNLIYIGNFDNSSQSSGLLEILESSFKSYKQSQNIDYVLKEIQEKKFNIVLIKEDTQTLSQIINIREKNNYIPILIIGDKKINTPLDYIKYGVSQYINEVTTPLEIIYIIEHKLKRYYEKMKDIQLAEENKAFKEVIDNTIIVSKTDLKGKITYANENFCEISGYTKEELIGKHHNIVRHPHMDKNIFADLWKTIKNNETWIGVVKNLTKGGETYITKSTITPFYKNGKKVGYLGIRYVVTDEIAQNRGIKTYFTKENFRLKNKIKNLHEKLEKIHAEHSRKIRLAIFEAGGNPLLSKDDNIELQHKEEIKNIKDTYIKELKDKDERHKKIIKSELERKRTQSVELEEFKKSTHFLQEQLNSLTIKKQNLEKTVKINANQIKDLNKKISDLHLLVENIPTEIIAKYSRVPS